MRVHVIIAGVWLFAHPAASQTPALDAFREFRRRLDENRETASLAARFVRPAHVPDLRTRTVPSGDEKAPTRLDADPLGVVHAAACRNGIPPDLAAALIEQESGFQNEVSGSRGEFGAAQILPSTAAGYDLDIDRLRTDFAYNVESSMRILRHLAERFPGDWRNTLRAYNGGAGFPASSAQVQSQTAVYADAVEARRSRYDSRCH
jgi:soluble lytic murein transglycosylase-like protein